MATEIKTGQRLKITMLIDSKPQIDRDVFESTGIAQQLPVILAGTVYEGVVSDLDSDGFFDLNFDNGQALGFYAWDSTITIEIVQE